MARTSNSLPFDRHKLRDLREERKLRQEDLAQRCTDNGTHTSRFQVVRAENGRAKPSRDHLKAYAAVLGVDEEDLLLAPVPAERSA